MKHLVQECFQIPTSWFRSKYLIGKNAISSWLSAHSLYRNGSIQERIVATKLGSITSIQAIFVPADDLTDPAPAIIFGHLDAITVLSRALAAKAIYPAVDPFNSTSQKSIC